MVTVKKEEQIEPVLAMAGGSCKDLDCSNGSKGNFRMEIDECLRDFTVPRETKELKWDPGVRTRTFQW